MLQDKLADYAANRATADPLPGGSAPFTSSESFKLRRDVNSAKNSTMWDHHLSHEGAQRSSSTLKSASRMKDPESTISLGTARPSAQYYPWQSLTVESRGLTSLLKENEGDVISIPCANGETGYDLSLALNYGYAAGSPQVLRFVTEHVEMVHNPPYRDWECALTCGTTSAIEIIFRMLCDKGETVLSERFTYPGTLEAAKTLGLKLLGVRMDEVGMIPEDLDSKLCLWAPADGLKPKLLYTIPSGQNPSGATQTEERRRAIYEIATRHDLIILEDDPYYFIQLRDPGRCTQSLQCRVNGGSDRIMGGMTNLDMVAVNNYVEGLPQSYLSLDTSGRVLRLDATSKILAPGLRCGWITGCAQLTQKFISHTEMSTVAPSGPSQVLLYKLLDETWGHEGFLKWLAYLSVQYSHRLRILVESCRQSLPQALCEWTTPSAGMFLWVHVDWTQHPAAKVDDQSLQRLKLVLDIEDRIYQRARNRGVLISKGSWFATDTKDYGEVFFRLTFAAAAEEDLRQAVQRLGRALHEEFCSSG